MLVCLSVWRRLLKIWGAVWKNYQGCLHCASRAVWGLLRDFPMANPRLQNWGGAVPKVLQPRVCPRKIPREPSHYPAAQCRHPRNSPEGYSFFHNTPRIFNSCSDYQNQEVHLGPKLPFKVWGPKHTHSKVGGLTQTLVKCESFSSVVWTNFRLSPVLCGPLNLTQLLMDCDSLSVVGLCEKVTFTRYQE